MKPRMVAAAAGGITLLAACSSPEQAPPARSPEAAPPVAAAPPMPATNTPASAPAPAVTTAHLLVMDAGGKALAGMAPIVNRQRNAFDEPVSRGGLSGADGTATVQAPADEHLYVRAWDPQLRYFAMNYYDLMPSDGGDTDTMTIQMREASGMRVQAERTDGSSAGGVMLEAMFSHPTAGPWWPATAMTDGDGVAIFKPVPPGQFHVEIRAEGAAPVTIDSLLLPPAEVAEAGAITLQ